MKLTWRELGNDELIEEGDLWINNNKDLNVAQIPKDADMFEAIFADEDELGQAYQEIRDDPDIDEGWHCWRCISFNVKLKIKEAAWNKPRNIDMTL